MPGAQRRVAVVPGLDGVQLADDPGREHLLELVDDDRAGELAAHLEDGLRLLLDADHVGPLGDGADHRLLAVDRLAGLHGVDRHPGVPVVGHAEQDGVDVLAGEDLPVVDVGVDAVPVDLLGVRPPARVQVGDGDELDAGHAEGAGGVDEPDDPHADRGDPHAVVRAEARAAAAVLAASRRAARRPSRRRPT